MPQIDAAISGHGPYRGRGYLFVGSHYYRYLWSSLHADPATLEEPAHLSEWKLGFDRVDAAVSDPSSSFAYFFSGRQFKRFSWRDDSVTGPWDIGDFGVPLSWQQIDAAVEGGGEYEGRTVLISGSNYVVFQWPTVGDPYLPKYGTCSHEIALRELGLTGDFQTEIHGALTGQGRRKDNAYFFRGERYVRYVWGRGPYDTSYPAPLLRGRWLSLPGETSPRVRITRRGHLDIRGPGRYRGSIFFDTDEETIRLEDQDVLRKLRAAEDDLVRLSDRPIPWTLRGWTDPRPSRRLGGNQGLSHRRAAEVRTFWGREMHPLPGDGEDPNDVSSNYNKVAGLAFTVEGLGDDPASAYSRSMHEQALSMHRRVDIWGPPIPRIDDPAPPPSLPRFTDTLWEAKIVGGLSVGAEGFETHIRGRTSGHIGKYLCFGYGVGVGGGVVIQAEWALGGSAGAVDFGAFEGPYLHASGKIQGTETQIEALMPGIHHGTKLPLFVWSSVSNFQATGTWEELLGLLAGGASVSIGVMILTEVT